MGVRQGLSGPGHRLQGLLAKLTGLGHCRESGQGSDSPHPGLGEELEKEAPGPLCFSSVCPLLSPSRGHGAGLRLTLVGRGRLPYVHNHLWEKWGLSKTLDWGYFSIRCGCEPNFATELLRETGVCSSHLLSVPLPT